MIHTREPFSSLEELYSKNINLTNRKWKQDYSGSETEKRKKGSLTRTL